MTDLLKQLQACCARDVNQRGLAQVPGRNLLSAYPDDFSLACQSLAYTTHAHLAIVTGFYIPTASPPASETDGPLGALYLARALLPVGIRVTLLTDSFCAPALHVGVQSAGLSTNVDIETFPLQAEAWPAWQSAFFARCRPTHLLALERVGPGHTLSSLQAQGASPETLARFQTMVATDEPGRPRSMRGRDLSAWTSPAQLLFEHPPAGITTLGIGDGGNEIGMGKLPWDLVADNIPLGGLIACRTPVDFLVVAGISNWGAYSLSAGVLSLRGERLHAELLDPTREFALLEAMVQAGPLVDGVTGQQTVTVDGLDFARYAELLAEIRMLLA